MNLYHTCTHPEKFILLSKKTVVGMVAHGVNNDDRNWPRLVENIIINHNQVDHCTFPKS